MGPVGARLRSPGRQLQVGIGGERVDEHGVGAEVRHLLGIFAQTLVDPQVLATIMIPVNHVLQFMGEHSLVVLAAAVLEGIQVDVEHLFLIGERVRCVGILVCTVEIARHTPAQCRRVQNVQARVAVHAGPPLVAKDFDCAGIGVGAETVDGAFQHVAIVRLAGLDPRVRNVGRVDQIGCHGAVGGAVGVVHPETLLVAHGIGRGQRLGGGRQGVRGRIQPKGEFAPVATG